MENYLKGIQYEKQVKAEILKNHKQCYLWNEIPLSVFMSSAIFESYSDKLNFLRKANFENDSHNISDTGCDLIYFDEDKKKYVIVQCKNYTKTITMDKLAGFALMVASTGLNGELYYTSSLSEPIMRYKQSQFKFIKHAYIDNNNNIAINNSSKKKDKLIIIPNKKNKMQPRDYQLEALSKLIVNKRSILGAICGLGKTFISILWTKRFDIIIIFSPLRQHAQQNLDRYKSELDDYEYVLVDCDGVRDLDKLKSFLNKNKKVVLSTTYKSCDLIKSLIDYLPANKVGVVIDEFHNLTSDNIMNENNDFYKVLSQDYNYLFMSATPRIYESENGELIDNSKITGNIEYSYPLGKAIQNNYVCDYNVYVPDISIPNEEQMKDVYKELKIKDLSNLSYDICAHFLLRNMCENGNMKCISYSKDIEDAKKLMESFTILIIPFFNLLKKNMTTYLKFRSIKSKRSIIIKYLLI